MDINRSIISQYKAALTIVLDCIEKCPEGLWFDKSKGFPIWHLCYHGLFFTDLYLHKGKKDFSPWEKSRKNYERFESDPFDQSISIRIEQPYSRDEMREYCKYLYDKIDKKVPELDMKSPSGFEWLPFSRLETHLYNLRHLEHHAGQMVDRLRNHGKVEVKWVTSG
ncbi:MAG: hypothetical protein JXR70_18510 [Spirochaetales bacterium]|nr:hypothetical protein [Spirochaetales bacterium]